MIGLDTNILVRYLTRDDPAQFQEAASLIAGIEARRESAFIPQVVLCETVWVLLRAYHIPKERIIGTLERLLHTPVFIIEARAQVAAALDLYRSNAGDWADYLIVAQARANGCTSTATFDQQLHAQPDLFKAPSEVLKGLRTRSAGRLSTPRQPRRPLK